MKKTPKTGPETANFEREPPNPAFERRSGPTALKSILAIDEFRSEGTAQGGGSGSSNLVLTVSPIALCCGEGQVITATARIEGGDKSKDVTLSYPGGSVTNPGTVTYVYSVTARDCGTAVPFSAVSGKKKRSANVPVLKIKHVAFATYPKPTERTKLGVGEFVGLQVLPEVPAPASIKWTTESGFIVSDPTINPAQYQAPERGVIDQVTATVTYKTPGKKDTVVAPTVTFNVVEPTNVTYQLSTDFPVLFHVYGNPSTGFSGTMFILDTDVSFINVGFREWEGTAIGWGCYEPVTGTPIVPGAFLPCGNSPNPPFANQNVLQIPGPVAACDQIWTYYTSPPSTGTAQWPIQWQFNVPTLNNQPNNNPKVFCTLVANWNCDATGTVTMSKGGVTVHSALADEPNQYVCGNLVDPT